MGRHTRPSAGSRRPGETGRADSRWLREFRPVEAGRLGVLGPAPEGRDDAGDLARFKLARHGKGLLGPDAAHMSVCCNGARGDGQVAVQKHWMGDAADMPELQHHTSARLMHGLGCQLPSLDLFARPDARRAGIADAHRRDRGRLADDQARPGALAVIFSHQRIGNACLSSAGARQRRHHDAIGCRSSPASSGSKRMLMLRSPMQKTSACGSSGSHRAVWGCNEDFDVLCSMNMKYKKFCP